MIRYVLSLLVLSASAAPALAADGGPCCTPPPGVQDLETGATTATTVALQWTAPVEWNDALDTIMLPTAYDLRFLDEDPNGYSGDWFGAASPVQIPAPQAPGTPESCVVTHLAPGTDYWFCIRTLYGEPAQPAGLSGYAPATTGQDTVPPEAVTTLHVTANGPSSVTLAWTAPGDREQPGQPVLSRVDHYQVKFLARGPIVTATDWSDATSYDPALSWSPADPGLPETNRIIAGLAAGTTYWFAVKSFDQVQVPSLLSNSVASTLPPLAEVLLGGGPKSKCQGSASTPPVLPTLAMMAALLALRRR